MPRQGTMLMLIVFAALSHKVTSSEVQMSMALNTVDDQYTYCRDEMLKKVVEEGLLEEEQRQSPEYNASWAMSACNTSIKGGVKEHTAALKVYGHGGKNLRKTFNMGVETQGGNSSVYKSKFQFKSLHFLLMDAMRLLKPQKCETVFRGSSKMYTAKVGSEVRFGRFTSAKAERAESEEDATDGTLFIITSCTVINMDTYASTPEDFDRLISPVEVFRVAEVKEVKTDNEKYIEIVLTSLRTESYHDCFLFPRFPTTTSPTSVTPKGSSTQWLSNSLSSLVAASLAAALITRTDHL